MARFEYAGPVARVRAAPQWESVRSAVASVPAMVWLGAIVVVSTAVRFALANQDPAPFIFQDELLYSELAKSLGTTGHFAVREVPGSAGVGPLYPALISPAYALFDSLPHAYAAAKAINALLMSVAAVPVYLVARRLLGPVASLVAAAFALSGPWLVYTSVIMTENAFYPVFLFWFLALVLTLERPTPLRQVAQLALLVLAYETRPQAVALLPALVTALVLVIIGDAWFGAERPRWRSLLSRTAAYWPTWLVLGGGSALFLVVEVGLRGHTISGSLLRAYAALGSVDYSVGGVLRWTLWHVAEMDVVVGVIPFAAFIAVVIAAAHRADTSPALRAFVAGALATCLWLFVEVGAFASSPISQRMQERNLFYVTPFFFIALVLWASRGVGRRWPAASLGALVAAGLAGVVPFASFLNENTVNDSFGLLNIWNLRDRLGTAPDRVNVPIVLAAIAAAAIFMLLPRRWSFIAPALVFLFLVQANNAVEYFTDNASLGSRVAGVSVRRDWVDHAVGPGAEVAALFDASHRNYVSLWDNEFFNRSIGAVYNFVGAPDGLPQQTVVIDPKTGSLFIAGTRTPVRSPYVLADTTLFMDGTRIATDRGVGMALYRSGGPIRLKGSTSSIYADLWSGPTAGFTGYRCSGGRLTVVLAGDANLLPRPSTIVAKSGERQLGRIVVPPGKAPHRFTIPLASKDGVCQVAFTVTPTAVPAQTIGGADTRELGIRFLDVRYRPAG